MARSGGSKKSSKEMVDGYTALKAIRDAQPSPPTGPGEASLSPENHQPDGDSMGTRIGKTVLPPENRIVCYECGYEFRMAGKTQRLACAKCHLLLDTGDHVIDQVWTEDLKTVGTVTISDGGVLTSSTIIANDVVLNGGEIKGGRVSAVKSLVLGSSRVDGLAYIQARDLTVLEGVDASIDSRLRYRKVELLGLLTTQLIVEEQLVIRSTGGFSGAARTPSLIVEDELGG